MLNRSSGRPRALADADQSQRMRIAHLLGGDPAAVVAYLQQQLLGALPQPHLDAAGVGVAGDVRQRLLHDAVDGGGQAGPCTCIPSCLRQRDFAFDTRALFEPARLGFDRLGETEVVENAAAATRRRFAAPRSRCASSVPTMRLRDFKRHRSHGGKIASPGRYVHLQRRQRLSQVVVELAGNPACVPLPGRAAIARREPSAPSPKPAGGRAWR